MSARMSAVPRVFWFVGPVLLAGCSSVSSYAVPTQGAGRPGAQGAVAIYATSEPTSGRELGIVEARGVHEDGAVEVLFPELVRRAQQLGGNALVIDQAEARFEEVTSYSSYQQVTPCGARGLCTNWQPMPVTSEQMVVVLRGRAWLLPAAAEGAR